MIAKVNVTLGLTLLLATASAITVQAWRQFKSYPKRLKKHEKEISDYQRDKYTNHEREEQHKRQVEEAKSPEIIARYRIELLQKLLVQILAPDVDSNAREGRKEAVLNKSLNYYFPGKINSKKGLSIPNFPHPYTPDFFSKMIPYLSILKSMNLTLF